MKRNLKLTYLAQSGIIAAVYAALTLLFYPLSFGLSQLRVSEGLCVLPFFTPAAVPGLFVGCIIANVFGGFGLLDIVCGSLATLLSAYCTYKIKNRYLAPLPAVLFNAVIVGAELAYLMNLPFWSTALAVGAGQAVSCYVLGLPLLFALEKLGQKRNLFGSIRREQL